MASIRSLGFNIFSHYDGGGFRQARRDIDNFRSGTILSSNALNSWSGRLKLAAAGLAVFGPALVPIAASMTATAGAATAMGAAVAASTAVYGAAMKGAIQRALEMDAAGKKLNASQKGFVTSVDQMKSAWQRFLTATEGKTLDTATHAVRGLTAGIGLLKPLLDAVHPSINQVAKDFEAWMKGDRAKMYAGIIAGIAKESMPMLARAGKDVLNVLGDGFRAFAPLASGVARALADGAARLREWSDSGGFQRFLEYVTNNAGPVHQFFEALKGALKTVAGVFKELSGGSLHIVTDALRAIAAIDPSAIKAMGTAFLLLKSPMLWLVLNCPPLRDLIIGILGAMNPAIVYALTAAFVGLRVAWMLMNTALLTTPLGWLVLAIGALVIAIVAIATKTTWFQTAWKYTWNAIKVAFEAVVNAIKVAWNATVNAFVTAWTAVSGALVTAWNATWNAVKVAVQAVWNALKIAWSAFTGALAAVWTAVSTALVAAWNAVWNGIKTAAEFVWNALKAAWNAFIMGLQTIWTAVSGALRAAWTAVWNGIKIAAEAVWNALKAAWSLFITGLQVIWNTVSAAVRASWSAVWNGMRTAAQAVWNALRAAWQAFLTAIQTIWNTVSAAFKAAWQAVWAWVRDTARAVWNLLQAAWSTFLNAIRTIWTTVSNAVKASWQAVWAWIRDTAKAVWNLLQSWWQAFLNAIRTIWTTAATAVKASWQAVWAWIRDTAKAVWNLLQSWWQAFLNAIRTIWNTVSNALKTAWQTVWAWIRDTAKAVWDLVQRWWDFFITAIKRAWDVFSGSFKKAWENTWNAVKSIANKVWHGIGEIIEKAINGVLKIVNGLIKGFNAITKFLKIDVKIGEIKPVNFNFAEGGIVNFAYGGITGSPPAFAKGGTVNLKRGGTLPGYAPGRDTVPAMLSRGEGVLTPEAVRGLGGPGFVHGANRQFAGHRGAGKGASPSFRIPRDSESPMRHNPGGQKGHHFAFGGMAVQHFAVGGMTAAALAKAGVPLSMVTQGEYSNGALSAGTHSGGGVVDIGSTSPAIVAALRAAGFAAWARVGGTWTGNEHIHAVLMNHPALSGPARAQVADFMKGGDGLGAGGGGGGADMFGMLKGHIGKILKNVYKGLNPLAGIGGAVADLFGFGDKEDDGGLFGTGIGPDVGPNVTDAVGGVVGAVTGANTIGGEMAKMLGQIVLSMLDKGSIAEGLSDAGGKLKKFGLAGEFGKIAVGFGKKILDEIMPDFLLKEKEKAGPMDFAGMAGGGGSVQKWAPMAAMALAKAGISASQLGKFLALMQAESGGNPFAMNNWDSNAAKGQASRGLMQVIPSTFAAYRDPSLSGNIFDPMANMVAAARYIKARYGGNVPGSPYAEGTDNATPGMHLVGEKGPELVTSPGYAMFGGGEQVLNATDTASALSGGGGGQAASGGAAPDVSSIESTIQGLISSAEAMKESMLAAWSAATTAANSGWQRMNAETLTPMNMSMSTTVPANLAVMQAAWGTNMLGMATSANTQWAAMNTGAFTPMNTMMTLTVPTAATAMKTAFSAQVTAMQVDATLQTTAMQTNVTLQANTMSTNVATAADRMRVAVNAAWSSLQASTKAAWADITTTVTNAIKAIVTPINALITGFNNVAKALDIDGTVPTITVAFATGGMVPGFAKGGMSDFRKGGAAPGFAPGKDRIPAMLSPGEGVLTPEAVRGLGGPGFIHAANRKWAGHRGAGKGGPSWRKYRRGQQREGRRGMRRFALGGMALNQQSLATGMPGKDGMMEFLTGSITAQVAAGLARAGVSQSLVTQGSFSNSVAASGGTHSGDGVVDLGTTSTDVLARLIAAGWAAWIRTPEQGFAYHIHAVLMNASGLSPTAAAQVLDFMRGGSGLGAGSVDPNSLAGLGLGIDPGEMLKKIVNGDNDSTIAGMGQYILALLDKEMVTAAFADKKKDLDAAKVGGGVFGQSLKAMGSKTYTGIIDKVMKEVEKAKAALAALMSSGGAIMGGPVPAGMAPAVFTSFWDDFQPMANGQQMNSTAIASSYLPLGSSVTVAYGGKSVTSTIQDMGPAQFVYDRYPGMAVLDLAEPLMQYFTGSRSNLVQGSWKLNSVGSGRTLYGTRLRGFQDGGIAAYDRGGWIPQGYSTVYNGTGKPELATPADDLANLAAAIRTGGAGGKDCVHVELNFNGPVNNGEDVRRAVDQAIPKLRSAVQARSGSRC